jgi:AcrR family transcriptional regulator
MSPSTRRPISDGQPADRQVSARQSELFERAYQYALGHGLADLALRPLAAAIGSSPRVLLYLYGSKEGLVRALLARARDEELTMLSSLSTPGDLAAAVGVTWDWLAAEAHRPLLTLWLDAYARSLSEPEGPWAGFARQTVADWLGVLAAAQPAARRRSQAGRAERTLVLAVLRGGLIDLLATGDSARASAAISSFVATLA